MSIGSEVSEPAYRVDSWPTDVIEPAALDYVVLHMGQSARINNEEPAGLGENCQYLGAR
jgi:hypothetical protein